MVDELDEVDREILYFLQEDARNNSATAIAEEVGVTANTVRNRISRLEDRGVVTGYRPGIDFEKTGFQLRVSIKCTAPVPDRTALAKQALDIDGVVAVRELMTGRANIELTVVGRESEDVTRAATAIHELGLKINEQELIKNDHSTQFDYFNLKS